MREAITVHCKIHYPVYQAGSVIGKFVKTYTAYNKTNGQRSHHIPQHYIYHIVTDTKNRQRSLSGNIRRLKLAVKNFEPEKKALPLRAITHF